MLLYLLHLGVTFLLAGIIWFVQLIHYPLFSVVGRSAFETFEKAHRQRIFYLIAPLMLLEIISGIALLIFHFDQFNPLILIFSLSLLILIWISTFFIQVPLHNELSDGFSPRAIRMLVMSNWIRTLAWTLRLILLLYLLPKTTIWNHFAISV